MEAESTLDFAGLHGLVRPILADLERVPEPQRRALGAALGLEPADAADRFLISAGVLSLLAAAAERGPLVCLIDDAQWLDAASADALVFAARRLGAEGIAILFAADDRGEPLVLNAAAAELNLGPDALDPAERSGLISTRGDVLTFGHPLIRAAIYESATRGGRQRVHAALARRGISSPHRSLRSPAWPRPG